MERVRIAGEKIYVPDTNALVEGIVSKLIREGVISGRIVIHRVVLLELEYHVSRDRAIGYAGLEEIKRLRELSRENLVMIELSGEIPRNIRFEEFDNSISPQIYTNMYVREYAYNTGATLITGDRVQAIIAESMGIPVIYVEPEVGSKVSIEKFFDESTMSIHLKENTIPVAKKGKPGDWVYVAIGDKPMTSREVEELAKQIIEEARLRPDSFIEIDRRGSTIIQLRNYRIIITRPPLSDGWEITAVRPLRKLKLEDYNLPSKLIERLNERAEGILIAGAPGMGKTTFAQALAEYYMRMGKVVKTIESPRDMDLPPEITQYSKHYSDLGELHDILLLSRPDYTVFDEMRSDEDFKLYADLRLAGIGMIGVVHATSPIDAIQRFIGRVELGMIPSLIDTVLFIKNGFVSKVYEVKMTVKLPTGLKEAELSRPVIEVRDFLSNELEYEIYTFGEQTVVVPIKKKYSVEAPEEFHEVVENIIKIMPDVDIGFENNTLIVTIPREKIRSYNRKIKRLRKLENKYNVTIKIKIK
uniref:ATPase n=1 Tax=Staphylothermus marinus TaxID=2280 RepID=A0A7C4HBF4_STAMA